ncbi:MAG TPA: chemotaxis protein CheB [Thermoanaerobaculia bacterium]|nr:chemotaxis protein CheB [Thermoanaerobaculia bacterium]
MAAPADFTRLEQEAAGKGCDLVVIAASAGGIHALQEILAGLPADFPVPVAVVQHRSPRPPNLLGKILGQASRLTVKLAEASEALRPGTIYLAPPDLHLIVLPNHTFALRDGQRIGNVLSSADPLFASAAEVLGGRVIAVVLTGMGHDASDGVQAVKAAGGTVIAQDEASSQYFAMPKSAIATGCVDFILPLRKIAPELVRLTKAGAGQ